MPSWVGSLQGWVGVTQLRHVEGGTEVKTVGGYTRQVQITPDPAKLGAYGLSLRDLVDAVGRNNENVGAGYIERSGPQYLIRVPGQVADAEGIERIVVATRDGLPLCIGHDADARAGRTDERRVGTECVRT